MTSYLTTHNQYLNQIAYRELGTENAGLPLVMLIFVGTGTRCGKGIDRVSLVTFTAMLKAFFKRTDPKRYIFYPHDQRGAKEAERVLSRLRQRTILLIKKLPLLLFGVSCAPSKSEEPLLQIT